MPAGDRPNFPLPSQRLDKVDVEAISDLKEELVIRAWASIMGPGSGLLSNVSLTWDGTYLTIGKCRLGYAGYVEGEDGGDDIGLVDGCVVRHNPDLGVGSNVLPLNEGTMPTGYVFFKVIYVEAEEENRAYWDGLDKQKKVGVALTRKLEACVFNFSATVDGLLPSDGWYPFLYLKGWVATVPALLKIHYFEAGQFGGQEYGLLFQRGATSPGVIAHSDRDEAFSGFPARGLAQHVRASLAAMSRMMDNAWVFGPNGNLLTAGTVGWRGTPTRGITQINDYIDDVVKAKINELVADNQVRERVLFWCDCDGDSSAPSITNYGGDYSYVQTGVPTASRVSQGVFNININDAAFNPTINCSTAAYNQTGQNGFARADYMSATQIQVVVKEINGSPDNRDWAFRLVVLGRSGFIPVIAAIP